MYSQDFFYKPLNNFQIWGFHLPQLLYLSVSTSTSLIALNGTLAFQASLLCEALENAMHFSCLLIKPEDKNAKIHFQFHQCMEKWDEDF